MLSCLIAGSLERLVWPCDPGLWFGCSDFCLRLVPFISNGHTRARSGAGVPCALAVPPITVKHTTTSVERTRVAWGLLVVSVKRDDPGPEGRGELAAARGRRSGGGEGGCLRRANHLSHLRLPMTLGPGHNIEGRLASTTAGHGLPGRGEGGSSPACIGARILWLAQSLSGCWWRCSGCPTTAGQLMRFMGLPCTCADHSSKETRNIGCQEPLWEIVPF